MKYVLKYVILVLPIVVGPVVVKKIIPQKLVIVIVIKSVLMNYLGQFLH